MTQGVIAVLYQTSDPERLCAFYVKAFGLEAPRLHGEDHLGVLAGRLYLGFDRVAAGTAGGRGAVSVWFQVANAHTAYAHLLALGARPKEPPDEECSPGEVLAQVYDPDGNVVGLLSGERREPA